LSPILSRVSACIAKACRHLIYEFGAFCNQRSETWIFFHVLLHGRAAPSAQKHRLAGRKTAHSIIWGTLTSGQERGLGAGVPP
jgi:hypothetical protein